MNRRRFLSMLGCAPAMAAGVVAPAVVAPVALPFIAGTARVYPPFNVVLLREFVDDDSYVTGVFQLAGPYYDPPLGKLVIDGLTREAA